jgi:hypothetical protein
VGLKRLFLLGLLFVTAGSLVTSVARRTRRPAS